MMEKINAPKMNACVAALFLGSATLNGVSALEDNNDAIRADAQAEVYEMVEMPPKAQQMQVKAGKKEDDRSYNLLIVGLNLSAAACFAGSAAIGGVSRRRYG
jgi:hypothetical protein